MADRPLSQTPEYRRARYAERRDRMNARRREALASDAVARDRVNAANRARRAADPGAFRAADAERAAEALVLAAKEHIGRCLRCGYSRSPVALQWHHVVPSTKTREPSSLRRTSDDLEAWSELKLCVLICANCHWEVESGLWVVPKSMVAESAMLLWTVVLLRAAVRASSVTDPSRWTLSRRSIGTRAGVTSMLSLKA